MSVAKLDDFFDSLGALQKRWDNRVSGKDLRVLGESYGKGRLSIALDFCCSHSITKRIALPPGANTDAGKMHLIVVFSVHDDDIVKCRDIDSGDEEVVLVDVVSAPNFPDKTTASTVRFYLTQECKSENWACLHYSSIRWRSLSRFGALEGGLKRLPGFVDRKRCSPSASRLNSHYRARNVVKGATEIVETISDGERQVGWHLTGRNAEILRSSIRIKVFDQLAEVTLDVGIQNSLNLADVAVGPIDL